MLGNSLRNLRPATVEEREANLKRNREEMAEYKKASRDIHEICVAKGIPEPVLVA